MQNYNNSRGNLEGINEVSGYLLLKINLNQVKIMSKCGLSVDDIRYIPMYEEYLSLRREGVPKERIYQVPRQRFDRKARRQKVFEEGHDVTCCFLLIFWIALFM